MVLQDFMVMIALRLFIYLQHFYISLIPLCLLEIHAISCYTWTV